MVEEITEELQLFYEAFASGKRPDASQWSYRQILVMEGIRRQLELAI